jgi:hypothetical protein
MQKRLEGQASLQALSREYRWERRHKASAIAVKHHRVRKIAFAALLLIVPKRNSELGFSGTQGPVGLKMS